MNLSYANITFSDWIFIPPGCTAIVHKCCKDSLPPCMKVSFVCKIRCLTRLRQVLEIRLCRFVLLRNFRISVQRARRRAGQHLSLRVSLQREILNPAVDVVGRSLCSPADFTVRDNSPQRAIPTSDSLPAVSPKERKDTMTTATSATGGFPSSNR